MPHKYTKKPLNRQNIVMFEMMKIVSEIYCEN
jgi:hypothetical protein